MNCATDYEVVENIERGFCDDSIIAIAKQLFLNFFKQKLFYIQEQSTIKLSRLTLRRKIFRLLFLS